MRDQLLALRAVDGTEDSAKEFDEPANRRMPKIVAIGVWRDMALLHGVAPRSCALSANDHANGSGAFD